MLKPLWPFARIVQSAVAAFLVGIFLHSCWPHEVVPMVWFLVAAIVIAFVFLFGRGSIGRIVAICLLSFVLGVWRFDQVRPSLVPSVQPFVPEGFVIQHDVAPAMDQFSPRYWLWRWRQHLVSESKQLLRADEAALLDGMLWGERSLSSDLKKGFQRAGLMHLVAVSGTNVTIFTSLLLTGLIGIGLTKRKAFWGVTGALIAFVLFVGFSASVLRAAIMGWLALLAPMVGRVPRATYLLLLSAGLFVLWQPTALIFDPSFALTMLATFGLLVWSPVIGRLLERVFVHEGWRTTIAITLSATLATFPYGMWAFHQFTLLGLLSNVVTEFLTPWIMSLGAIGLLIGRGWALLPVRGLLDVVLWIGQSANQIQFGVWTNVSISFWMMVAIYLLMGWGMMKLERVRNE